MFKKIALIGVFAIASVISFGTSQVRAAKNQVGTTSVGSPTPRGLCGNVGLSGKC